MERTPLKPGRGSAIARRCSNVPPCIFLTSRRTRMGSGRSAEARGGLHSTLSVLLDARKECFSGASRCSAALRATTFERQIEWLCFCSSGAYRDRKRAAGPIEIQDKNRWAKPPMVEREQVGVRLQHHSRALDAPNAIIGAAPRWTVTTPAVRLALNGRSNRCRTREPRRHTPLWSHQSSTGPVENSGSGQART